MTMEIEVKPFIRLGEVMTGPARNALANEIEVALQQAITHDHTFQTEPGYGHEHSRYVRVSLTQRILYAIETALEKSKEGDK